ncbi:hypothetical protein M378DRAFT_183229 [Amanita muscaria Koide BX008]|uniref:SPRY-domain-containing protein n=1 Tax=Amanita muscaria (strain Koide BX008) TaxID=946122 RepID=A0A0C2TTG6_AMAMK|nr:hypothetical protein M378DRAFT_183229 [Amanita muscaria Koide BX008]
MSPSTDSDDESNASPPREPPPVPPASVLASDQILRLPTRWSDQMKYSSLSISADGRDLTVNGSTSNGDRDAAAARTSHPIPPACGIYYYEVSILSKGQKGHISIGFAGRDVKLNRLPGWEQNSWGYHADDGFSYAAEKTNPYGPTYSTNDVIGCGIDFTAHKAFFTKNGTLLGPVFDGIGKDIEIYPSVGLRHNGESVRVNFGHEPFRFDIEYHVQQQRNSTWRKILSTPVDNALLLDRSKGDENKQDDKSRYSGSVVEARTRSMMNKLVLSYLIHHGYAKTAHALQKQHASLEQSLPGLTQPISKANDHDIDMDCTSPAHDNAAMFTLEDDIERRTRIVNAVVAGDIELAISETTKYHPLVLEAEAGLMLFRLRCRKFVELVLEASELKKKNKEKQVIMEVDGTVEAEWEGMDIDDDSRVSSVDDTHTSDYIHAKAPVRSGKGRESTTASVEQALNNAIAYGQSLANDYKADTRPEVKQMFRRTFAIVAFDDPREAGGVVAEVVSPDARINLANELNQAILKSQGHPTRPALETLCRHTATCIKQLGLLGNGTAAFADMSRELLGET